MTTDSDNVRVAVAGELHVGHVGATAPTSTSSSLAPTNEIQTVTITGTPTGGTFTLSFENEETTAIAYNAAGSAVQAALEALDAIGAGNVAVTGGPGPGTPYSVTFQNDLGGENVEQMVAASSLTGGSSPNVAVTTATPGTGFVGLGYVSENGVTEARQRATNDIKAWQNADIVRTTVTDAKITYKLMLLETKKEVVEAYYGTTVTQTSQHGTYDVIPAHTGGRKAWVLDWIDGEVAERIYLPSGEVTDVGDMVYQNGQPIGYEITITGYSSGGFSARKWNTALKAA